MKNRLNGSIFLKFNKNTEIISEGEEIKSKIKKKNEINVFTVLSISAIKTFSFYCKFLEEFFLQVLFLNYE